MDPDNTARKSRLQLDGVTLQHALECSVDGVCEVDADTRIQCESIDLRGAWT
jgi:hypothetical protein